MDTPVVNSFQEMAAGTGASGTQGTMSDFNDDSGQFERQSIDWLKQHFFECEMEGVLTVAVYRYKPTSTRFILEEFFGSPQEAQAFYKQLQAEMREADTDTWVPA